MDLVLQFIMSHIELEPMDQLYEPFEYYQQDNDELHIRRYSPVQKMEHKYRMKEEESTLPTAYRPWKKVFKQKASEQFPEWHPWDHEIELEDGFMPKQFKPYTLGPRDQKLLDAWIKEQLKKGYIKWSKLPQASGFFFVETKNARKKCPCQDYKYLNKRTKPNAYPLPLISNLMLKLKGSQYFMKLDIQWGYNNVRLKQGNEWKAAFMTNWGLFELTVMFFGLMNSPATFQAMMDDYFKDVINKRGIVIYMDGILIHAETKEKLMRRMKQVLDWLKKHDIYLNLDKCCFKKEEVEYLGCIILKDAIKMDLIKLSGIRDWPPLTTVKQTRSFLGFRNFYQKFISGFAHIAWPLHDLMKKNKIWEWTKECQHAFDTLEEKFMTAPVLTMADVNKLFILEMDASKWAIGAALIQKDNNRDLHPCGFLSHALTPTEQNWQIYNRELFAIIYTLDKWKHLLLGA